MSKAQKSPLEELNIELTKIKNSLDAQNQIVADATEDIDSARQNISKLKEDLKKQEGEKKKIDDLSGQEHSDLSSKRASAKTEANKKIVELKEQVLEREIANFVLDLELKGDELNDKLAELEEDHSTADKSRKAEIMEEIGEYESQVAPLREILSHAEDKTKFKLSEDLESLEFSFDGGVQEIPLSDGVSEKLISDIKDIERKLPSSVQNIDETAKSVESDAKKATEEIDAKINKINSQIKQQETILGRAESDKSQAEVEIHKLTEQKEKLERKQARLEHDREKDLEIEKLKKEAEELKLDNRDLRERAGLSDQQREQLSAELGRLKTSDSRQVELLKRELAQVRAQNEELQEGNRERSDGPSLEELKAFQTRMRDLEEELRLEQEKVRSLERPNVGHSLSSQMLESSSESLETLLDKTSDAKLLQANIGELNAELKILKENLAKAQSEALEAVEVAKITAELEKTKAELEAKKQELIDVQTLHSQELASVKEGQEAALVQLRVEIDSAKLESGLLKSSVEQKSQELEKLRGENNAKLSAIQLELEAKKQELFDVGASNTQEKIRLEAQVTELTAKQTALQEQEDRSKAELASLRIEQAEVLSKLKAKQADEIATLQSQVDLAKTETEAKKTELQVLQTSLSEVAEEKETLRQSLESVQSELELGKGDKQQLESSVKEIQAELEENRRVNEHQSAQVVALEADLAKSKEELQTQKDQYEQALEALKANNAKELADLQKQLSESHAKSASLQSEIEKQNAALELADTKHSKKLGELDGRLAVMSQKLADAKENSDNSKALKAQMNSLKSEKIELIRQNQLEVARLKTDLESMRAEYQREKEVQAAAQKENIVVLQSQTEAISQERQSLSHQLTQLSDERVQLQEEKFELEERRENLQSERSELQEQLVQTQNNDDLIANLQQQLAANASELEFVRAESQRNKDETEKAQEELAKVRESYDEASKVLEKSFNASMKAFAVELEMLRGQFVATETRTKELETELKAQQEALVAAQIKYEENLGKLESEIAEKSNVLSAVQEGSEREKAEYQKQLEFLYLQKSELEEAGRQELEGKEQELMSTRGELEASMSILATEQQQYTDSISKLQDTQRKELEGKEQELQDFQLSLELAEERIDELEKEVESFGKKEELLQMKIETLEEDLGQNPKLKHEILLLKKELQELVAEKHSSEELIKEFQEVREHQLEELHDLQESQLKLKQSHLALTEEIVNFELKFEHTEEARVAVEIPEHKIYEQAQRKGASVAKANVDNVIISSDDEILQKFKELREIQKDVVVNAVEDVPKENEEFHKYVSKEGNKIGNKLDKETLNLLASVECEKYKEIHKKYQHSEIDWSGENQATIKKDGKELCKLTSKIKEQSNVYKLDGKEITNYRSLDLPLKAESGPIHMSFVVKDLNGKNINDKDAVYLTAHYNKDGKLMEMTTPIPVHYTSEDKNSPLCIKRDGQIYTLPINRGQYEKMLQEIEKNKNIESLREKVGPHVGKTSSVALPTVKDKSSHHIVGK